MTTTAQQIIENGNAIYDHALTLDQYAGSAALAASGAWVRTQAEHACKNSKTVNIGLFVEGDLYTFADGSRILMDGDLATCSDIDVE